MDYFHLEAKVVSRGSGRSVIAAAAYAMIDKELQEEPIYEKPKSISERLKREPDHDQQAKKPKKKDYER